MRHRRKLNHLSRKSEHRKAMLSNMAASLIEHKRITTTVAKAKALRVYVEPLITKAKDDTTHSRRQVFSYLQNKEAVAELFRDVALKVGDRPGGYTRILKTGNRQGDNAEMCMIELVDYNENMLSTSETAKEKAGTRRSRRGGKKKTDAGEKPVAAEKKKDVVAEVPESAEEKTAETVSEESVEEPAEESQAEEVVAEVEKPEVETEKAGEEQEDEKAEEPKEEEVKTENKDSEKEEDSKKEEDKDK